MSSRSPKSRFLCAALMRNWSRVWRTAVDLERQITVYDVGSTVATFCWILVRHVVNARECNVPSSVMRHGSIELLLCCAFSVSPHLCLCDATLVVTLKNSTQTWFTSCLCVNRQFGKVSQSFRPGSTVFCVELAPCLQVFVIEI